jgi:hypothetical protein
MFKKAYILLVLCLFSATIQSQDTQQAVEPLVLPANTYDCTVVELDAVADNMLTKAERVAQMDTTLQDSIDKHDQCVEQVVNNNAASGSGEGSGEGDGNGNGKEGKANADGSANSDPDNGQQVENAAGQANSESEINHQQEQAENDAQIEGNGSKSQDIAPQDNDSAVCRLLKDELNIEKDPKKQGELKAMYNNYNCRG